MNNNEGPRATNTEQVVISKIIDSGEITPFLDAGITAEFFGQERWNAAWKWVYEYWTEHGETPSAATFARRFPYELVGADEPSSALVVELIERRRYFLARAGITEAVNAFDKGDVGESLSALQRMLGAVDRATPPDTVLLSEVGDVRLTKFTRPGIPQGMLTLLVGAEGTGKGLFLAHLTAQVTTGALDGECKNVLVLSTEDDLRRSLKPRLIAAGADLDRVHHHHGLTLPDDLPVVEKLCKACDIRLVIADPLMAMMPSRVDTHKYGEMVRWFAPMHAFLGDLDVAMVAVVHTNKSSGARSLDRIQGSRAITAAARSVLVLERMINDAVFWRS